LFIEGKGEGGGTREGGFSCSLYTVKKEKEGLTEKEGETKFPVGGRGEEGGSVQCKDGLWRGANKGKRGPACPEKKKQIPSKSQYTPVKGRRGGSLRREKHAAFGKKDSPNHSIGGKNVIPGGEASH